MDDSKMRSQMCIPNINKKRNGQEPGKKISVGIYAQLLPQTF